jgi:signal transduction histidine kinase
VEPRWQRGRRWVPLPPLVGVALAFPLIALATAVRLALADVLGPAYPLVTLYPAVALAAWLGLACGLTATVLSVPVAAFALFEPTASFEVTNRADHVALVIFVTLASLGSLVIERFRRARRDAERANAVRDEFLVIASHELRTPLTALTLHLDAMRRRIVEGRESDLPTIQRKLEAALRQSARMDELITILLDVARLSRRDQPLRLTESDLVAVARDVIDRYAHEATERDSEVALEATQPVRGRFDRARIDAVVANLLSNAIKYGDGKPVEVHVFAEDDKLCVRVRDHGIGIADGDRYRIFGRFERAVADADYSGFGIGLYLAREHVHAHGGTISVDSEPGKGSEFLVSLPRR